VNELVWSWVTAAAVVTTPQRSRSSEQLRSM
jgi:hypothetical protein